jgi:hypothetical protein
MTFPVLGRPNLAGMVESSGEPFKSVENIILTDGNFVETKKMILMK